MGLEFQLELTEADRAFQDEAESRKPNTRCLDDLYFLDVGNFLSEMDIVDAKISLIRREDCRFLRGSYRIPLLVETDDNRFIIKDYDGYDYLREIAILEKVSGVIAPKVLHFGTDMYAEKYLDSEQFSSLNKLADARDPNSEELGSIIYIGVWMHAELAKLKINYHHNHWMDEFFITTNPLEDQERKIVDFGKSFFFFSEEDMSCLISGGLPSSANGDYIDIMVAINRCARIKSNIINGSSKYLGQFLVDNEGKDEQIKALLGMQPLQAANVLYVLEFLEDGLKTYFRTTGNDPSNTITLLKPKYTQTFFDCYLS